MTERFGNVLLSMVNHGFCQAFISMKFSFPTHTAEELYEVPYSSPDGGGNYTVGLCADNKTVSCGDYQGSIILPTDSFKCGLAVFIKQYLPQAVQEDITATRNNDTGAKIVLLHGKPKRIAIIRKIIDDAERIAREKGLDFSRTDMPGTKQDLSDLVMKYYKQEFLSIRYSTLGEYYSECGLKFRPGTHSGAPFIVCDGLLSSANI